MTGRVVSAWPWLSGRASRQSLSPQVRAPPGGGRGGACAVQGGGRPVSRCLVALFSVTDSILGAGQSGAHGACCSGRVLGRDLCREVCVELACECDTLTGGVSGEVSTDSAWCHFRAGQPGAGPCTPHALAPGKHPG